MKRRVVLSLAGLGLAAAVALAITQPWADDDAAPAAPATTTTTDGATTTTDAPASGTPGAAGVGDPYFPHLGNGGYDVEHYTLDLTWRADEGMLDGVVTIEAGATQDLSRFNLDLAGMDVRSVTVDGEAAETSPRTASW